MTHVVELAHVGLVEFLFVRRIQARWNEDEVVVDPIMTGGTPAGIEAEAIMLLMNRSSAC